MMLATSNMTSLLTNDCAGNTHLKYRCANEECFFMSSLCPTSSKCPWSLPDRRYMYFCPLTGWCERMDTYCLRPCGFKYGIYHYDAQCTGYPGLCGLISFNCPPVCSKLKPYKCLKERKCVKGPNWCGDCSGFRCKSDRTCISSYKKCDGLSDCSDGSDEISCYTAPADPGDGTSNEIALESWQILAICGVVLLVLLLCTYWCCKNKRDSNGEQSRTVGVTSRERQTTTSSGPRLTGATMPSATTSSPPYRPHQSHTPVTRGQSEAGYHPLSTNNTQHSYPRVARSYPVDQPVDSAPSRYPRAASNHPLHPPSTSVHIPNENSTAAPPPSYSEVIENDDQYKLKDPALPTYEEYTESPSAKETFM
ncbi:prolow-density lipoprotein receptor-related protein 1-like [Lineus longissimus]|uniref:prolow-density lipoprotein receptor-related protein 1-like n=1 Tax=Lineus longissimus TaxID=88925 RepID=UPI002B4EEF22